MHIQDVFDAHPTTFSFEFFPPRTEAAAQRLFETVRELEALKPAFVDVTYGAGGSTGELTNDLVLRIHRQTGIETIPHLTCVCHSRPRIDAILEQWAGEGVSNILALGGDVPRDKAGHDRSRDAFRYAAELVAHIKDFRGPFPENPRSSADKTTSSIAQEKTSGGAKGNFRGRGRGFGVGVAGFPEGHPGTPNRLLEMDRLKAKVDAGADYICTQLFFENRDFYDFRERCELAGINVPILAGLMPITSALGMARMADLAAGARYPARLLRAIGRCGDDEDAVKRVGIHWATEQCRDLLDHQVRGIHFYTLNQSDATRQIYHNLGATDSAALGS